jgi:hypothetical protein
MEMVVLEELEELEEFGEQLVILVILVILGELGPIMVNVVELLLAAAELQDHQVDLAENPLWVIIE